MNTLCCHTDWIANACTFFAGACSAFVAWIVWQQQKKLQREQIRFERNAQVARLKNLLVDIQFNADNFLSDVLSSIRFIDVRNRKDLYNTYGKYYNNLVHLSNDLTREERLATILATSKEYIQIRKDLEMMIQFQLKSWYNLSTIVMRVDPAKIQKVYADSYQRHNPDNKVDSPKVRYGILTDILALNPENSYMAGFTFAEFLGANYKVFHTDGNNIYQTIDKIVGQK